MYNVVEHALVEVVRSGRALTVSKANMLSVFQTETVPDTIFKYVLSHTGFIVAIAETAEKMVDLAIDEYGRRGMEVESTAVAGNEL